MGSLRLVSAQQSDQGQVRDHNEDAVWPSPGDFTGGNHQSSTLFIVADGVGGHRAGDVASRLAVETISHIYCRSLAPPDERLKEAIRQANQIINQQNNEQTDGMMGTTVVCAAVEGDRLYLANVGDSRAYLIRDGQMQRLSEDHTFVGELLQAGVLTPEEAKIHPRRHVITRSLGKSSETDAYFRHEYLQPGDTLVLCSDGLYGLVSEQEIRTVACDHLPLIAVDQLVALANARGGTDNISVIIVRATN